MIKGKEQYNPYYIVYHYPTPHGEFDLHKCHLNGYIYIKDKKR